jgi:hypothetical protein
LSKDKVIIVLKIRLRAKNPQIESKNMLDADCEELADLIRELDSKHKSEERKGTFTLHSFKYDTAMLELEFKQK